jgi:hypothetical protein
LTANATLPGSKAKEPGAQFAPELRQAIEAELEAICNDSQFGSSPRNCEFLRYVVVGTLEGRATEIKERTIGTELFGRPVMYDTGSDAVVRVRANEVRKRLACYYEEHESQSGWRIQMPLRSYVPRFLPEPQLATVVAAETAAGEVVEVPAAAGVVLTLSQMMMPTLVALFLCAATFRWQVFSGTPYLDFWDSLLAGHSSIALVLDADSADSHAVSTDDLNVVSPLLQTAATLHVSAQVQSSTAPKPDRAAVVPIWITHRTPSGLALPPDNVEEAYLTVVPGKQPELRIAGTSPAAIALAIRSMSSEDDFPQALGMALRRNTPTRIRIAEGQQITVQNVASNTASGDQLWPH